MIDAEKKLAKITAINERYSREMGKTQDTIACLELLEQAGIPLVDSWYDIRDYQPINRSDLPKIRKVVGTLEMVSKETSWDFENDGNINVIMAPIKEPYRHMRFVYSTPYRKGGRCKVVTTSTISTNLVCSTSHRT